MIRHLRNVFFVTAGITVLASASASAQIPTTYTGKPFDPAVAGGAQCPPGVKAGPYAIPGRLNFVNYDLGGQGIAFKSGDHGGGAAAAVCRQDTPTPIISWTGQCNPGGCLQAWYDTSPTLDGTHYPGPITTPPTGDFYLTGGQIGDYYNFTVNVATAGTYSLSTTFASGNGPPGGEGGDGWLEIKVFVNDTMQADWKTLFPDYTHTTDFHHWKAYPNFATVTLTAGPNLIKFQNGAKHIVLDYVQFDLATDGGVAAGDAGGAAGGGGGGTTGGAGSGAGGTSGAAGGSGAAGTSGAAGVGAAGSPGAAGSGAAGDTGSGSAGSPGAAGTTGTTGAAGTTSGSAGTSGPAAKGGSGCACTTAGTGTRGWPTGAGLLLLGCALLRRRRSRGR